MTHPDARPYIWMLCGSFSFSVMAILADSLTRRTDGAAPLCDWQTVAVFRAALVALFGAMLVWQAGVKLVWFRPWRLWVRSVAGSCSMLCAFYAFGHLHSEDVVTLSNTFPIWVAVLSWPMYGHLPNWKTLVAICIGVCGVVLVEQPHIESGNLGVLAALAAAGFTAVAMLGLHRLHDIDPRAVVVHFSSVATIFCVGAFLLTPRTEPVARVTEPLVLFQLLGIGISATIGQVFLTLAFGRGAPAKVSVVGSTQIVFVLGMCMVVFHRTVNTVELIGTALVIAPTAWLLTQSKATSAVKPRAEGSAEEADALPCPEPKREPEAEEESCDSTLSTPELRL